MTDTQAMTLRLPRDLYEAIRRFAFETRLSMNEIITTELRDSLTKEPVSAEQYGDLCALFEAAWHHDIPDTLDELAPVTSKEARKLALMATEVMSK